jgi:hypothetical protein
MMPEYIFRGRVELDGVDFFISAETPLEAVKKAKAGDYDRYEADGAEMVNCEIDPLTGQDNQ